MCGEAQFNIKQSLLVILRRDTLRVERLRLSVNLKRIKSVMMVIKMEMDDKAKEPGCICARKDLNLSKFNKVATSYLDKLIHLKT